MRNLAATMGGACLVASALSGCSPDAPEPKSMPTTYDIEKVDLTAAEPKDICRIGHPTFLRDLLLQISNGLPPGSKGFDFRNLKVERQRPDGEWVAMVRFNIVVPGEPAQSMRAVAPFDPENCKTGEWLIHRGEEVGRH